MILPTDNFKKRVDSIMRAKKMRLRAVQSSKMANLIRKILKIRLTFYLDSQGGKAKCSKQKFSGCFHAFVGHPNRLSYPVFIALFYVLHWFFDTSRWTPFGMRSTHSEVSRSWYMISNENEIWDKATTVWAAMNGFLPFLS